MTERTSPRARGAAATRALAAELGHELNGGLGLFRLVAERLQKGEAPDDEERAALAEELEHLRQLAGRLREFARTPLEREEHTPRAIVEAACTLAGADHDSGLELAFEAADDVRLSCDIELLARGLAELIDNALTARAQRAGVFVTCAPTLTFGVWDDGPGFEQGVERAARWGFTTRAGALGLGLTLASRAARVHGLQLEFERSDGRTLAKLLVLAPGRDKVTP